MTEHHTPEPWYIINNRAGRRLDILHSEGDYAYSVAQIPYEGTAPTARAWANARRIVACVNGCRGIDPAAVGELVARCEDAHTALAALPEDALGRDSIDGFYYRDWLLSNLETALTHARGEEADNDAG